MSLIPDTTRLANTQEQLESVLSNIRTSSEELKKLYDECATQSIKLAGIKEEFNNLETECKKLSKSRINILEDISKKERVIKEKELRLSLDKESFEEYKESQIQEVRNEVEHIRKSISYYEDKNLEIISVNKLILSQFESEIQKLEDIQIKSDLAQATLNEIEENLRLAKDARNKEIKNIAEETSKAKKELESVYEKIEKEKEKVQKPMELLAERNFTIAKRERNLNIMIKRFIKEFEKLHPNLKIRI